MQLFHIFTGLDSCNEAYKSATESVLGTFWESEIAQDRNVPALGDWLWPDCPLSARMRGSTGFPRSPL